MFRAVFNQLDQMLTVTMAEMIVSITAAIALIMLLIAPPMADTIDP